MVDVITDANGAIDPISTQGAVDGLRLQVKQLEKELDAQLERFQDIIDGQLIVNPGSSATQRSSSAVSKVTGIRSVAAPVGTFVAAWNAIADDDFLRYEVQVDDNPNFTSPETFRTTELKYLYEEAQQDVTYYVRVRAVNRSGVAGPWSAILNTVSGKASSSDISADSTSLVEFEEYGPFSPVTASGSVNTYGSLNIATIGGPVLIYTVAETDIVFSYTGSGQNRLTLQLLRNGNPINRPVILDLTSQTLSTTNSTVTTGLPSPIDEPPAGIHTYGIEIRNDHGAANTLQYTLQNLTLTAVEMRR